MGLLTPIIKASQTSVRRPEFIMQAKTTAHLASRRKSWIRLKAGNKSLKP